MPELRTVARAIGIYLKFAYPNGVPERITTLVNGLNISADEVYGNPAFVRQENGDQVVYSLRLGCAHYPHMKMLVAAWPGGRGFYFKADSHDKHILVPITHPEHAAFAELRHNNQMLVEAIESAWGDAGIPTYAAYLSAEVREFEQSLRRS